MQTAPIARDTDIHEAIPRSAFPLDIRIQPIGGAAKIFDRDGKDIGKIEGVRDIEHSDLRVYTKEPSGLAFHTTSPNHPLFETEDEIQDGRGAVLGSIIFRTASSFTKERFDVFSGEEGHRTERFVIEETSALVRMVRNLSEDYPWLDLVQGFLMNPTYELRRSSGDSAIARIQKMPSALETHWRIELVSSIPKQYHDLAVGAMLVAVAHASASN